MSDATTPTRRPGRPRLSESLKPVTLSLPASLVARLEAVQARLTRDLGWTSPSRSGVGRLALERGLALLEHESAATPGGAT